MRNRAALVGLVLSIATVLWATAGWAGAKPPEDRTHPPGNNGTVKVDGAPFDSAPDNESQPGCVFEIDFYGYDQGDLDATYQFDVKPPSGRGELSSGSVFIGEDPAGGGRDLDASTGPIDLSQELAASGATANRNRGYHVSLTIHAEGSIGSDVKHKVFWVECDTATTGAGAGAAAAGPAIGHAPAAAIAGRIRPARPAHAAPGTPAFTG